MTNFIKTTYTKRRGNGHIIDKLYLNLGATSYEGF